MKVFILLLCTSAQVYACNSTLMHFVDPTTEYLTNVLALVHQLHLFDVKSPLIVMLDSFGLSPAETALHEKLLHSIGVDVIVRNSDPIVTMIEKSDMLWVEEFRRLLIFNETQFCKILFLDQNYLPLQNMY